MVGIRSPNYKMMALMGVCLSPLVWTSNAFDAACFLGPFAMTLVWLSYREVKADAAATA